MANRKSLKKNIKAICSELMADCMLLRLTEQANLPLLDELMQEILLLCHEYVCRINHTERGSERIFYRKLRQEFTQKAEDLSQRIIKA